MLGEHGEDDVEHDEGLGPVRGSDFDENVLRGEFDLRVVTIDDGREGKDNAVAVVDDWVHRWMSDDVEVGC